MQPDLTLQTIEREHILRVLRDEPNKTRAALLLGIDRRTLYRKLEVYKRDGFLL
jgi:transcriptional regulator with PAS, ATPase and Fis domain